MTMLSESDSWNVAPMRFAAIIAGASCGDIVTAWVRATDSIGGTRRFSASVNSSHTRMIGMANARTKRMKRGRLPVSVLMRLSPDRRFGRDARWMTAHPGRRR